MNTLIFWTMAIILYQTVLSIIMSWLILSCKLQPHEAELHELTLIKLLYLYDPEVCGRVYFYNHTTTKPGSVNAVVWPIRNYIASGVRQKVKVWLSLHVSWTILGAIYVVQGQRPCTLYVALLSFTLVGIAILVMDVTFTVLFLMDINMTNTEENILKYINSEIDNIRELQCLAHSQLKSSYHIDQTPEPDTSWVCLLMAYISCRAVVQWMINFWIIKDNYVIGLQYYHHIHKSSTRKQQEYLEIY